MNNEKIHLTNQLNIRFLFVTANTGTVFEKPELLTAWVTEFANLVRRHPSDFIALHCQEVGGKDYERFMHILDPFLKDILQIPEIATDFIRYRLYFDSDYTSQDTFTALGSAYFIRNNIPIEQWNFTTSSFQNVVNRQIFSGNLINAQTLRKEKFPREFFPEAKWSRKGFTQTRWSIDDFIFDMINVHLFHDASNILAVAQSPSIYSGFRKNALQYTLRSLPLNSSDVSVPYVIFGDFNFRLDAHRLLEHIAKQRNGSINTIKQPNSDEISKIIIKNEQDKTKLTVEKKEFNLHDDHDSFFRTDSEQFQIFDFEFSSFNDQLFEYEKFFPPSYPYSEEHDEAHSYLRARCPAWCDRILLSHSFKNFVNTEINRPSYSLIGEDVCMGDHKPVSLALTIHLAEGWSTSSSPITSVSSSSSSFLSNCEDRVATSNINPCDTSNNNNNNQTESPVTVMRENDRNIILNEIQLSTNDINLFNIHDYAIFVQQTLLPQWWFIKLRLQPIKTTNTSNNSSKLWAKVRAVAYMTTLGHRTGSWYSDDQTEKSQIDSLSLSDNDENPNPKNIELTDLEDYNKKSDLGMPLRRSFSSIDYVKRNEIYSTTLSRSRSTTLINSSDHLTDSPHIDLSLPSPPSPPPQSPSRSNDNNRRLKNLPFVNNINGLNSTEIMNNKSQQIKSSLTTINQSKLDYENVNNKKGTLTTTTNNNNNNDDQRTVLARHIFHANIKQTLTRWIRETPV